MQVRGGFHAPFTPILYTQPQCLVLIAALLSFSWCLEWDTGVVIPMDMRQLSSSACGVGGSSFRSCFVFGGQQLNDSVSATPSILHSDLWEVNMNSTTSFSMSNRSVDLLNGYGSYYDSYDSNCRPGARYASGLWASDDAADLWLFGGWGYGDMAESATPGSLSDLFQFDTSLGYWKRVAGDTGVNSLGVFVNVSDDGSLPAARSHFTTFGGRVANASLFLFGGEVGGAFLSSSSVYNTSTTSSEWHTFADFWRFDLAAGEWRTMVPVSDGSWNESINAADDSLGVYGDKGVFDGAINHPPGRSGATGWVSAEGDSLYLSFGLIRVLDGTSRVLRCAVGDIWEYSLTDSAWRWIGGTKLSSSPTSCADVGPAVNAIASPGSFSSGNVPAARAFSHVWTFGALDSLSLHFGGGLWRANADVFVSPSEYRLIGSFSDLWAFDAKRGVFRLLEVAAVVPEAAGVGLLGQIADVNAPLTIIFLTGKTNRTADEDAGAAVGEGELWELLHADVCFGLAYLAEDDDVCGGPEKGVCVSENNCSCVEGYSGLECTDFSCYGIDWRNTSSVCGGPLRSVSCDAPDSCTCEPDYLLPDCLMTSCFGVLSDAPSVCSGHGDCVAYDTCVCTNETLYAFPDCMFSCGAYNATDAGAVCSGHGDCLDVDVCNCTAEYDSASDCGSWSCFSVLNTNSSFVCAGHGTCSAVDTCIACTDDYYGTECADFDCSTQSDCSSHGVCVAPDSCVCDTGDYLAPDCRWLCDGQPPGVTACHNHGSCIAHNNCSCVSGYSGPYCGDWMCDGVSRDSSDWQSLCHGRGNCTASEYCSCIISGYSGTYCDDWLCFTKPKTAGDVCHGKGNCVGPDDCSCVDSDPAKYNQETCDYGCYGYNYVDVGACSGHGSCVAADDCSCEDNYAGDGCEEWECSGIMHLSDTVCGGHGQCTEWNYCSCETGYSGATTECSSWQCNGKDRLDASGCNGKGSCEAYNDCHCSTNYYGNECKEYIASARFNKEVKDQLRIQVVYSVAITLVYGTMKDKFNCSLMVQNWQDLGTGALCEWEWQSQNTDYLYIHLGSKRTLESGDDLLLQVVSRSGEIAEVSVGKAPFQVDIVATIYASFGVFVCLAVFAIAIVVAIVLLKIYWVPIKGRFSRTGTSLSAVIRKEAKVNVSVRSHWTAKQDKRLKQVSEIEMASSRLEDQEETAAGRGANGIDSPDGETLMMGLDDWKKKEDEGKIAAASAPVADEEDDLLSSFFRRKQPKTQQVEKGARYRNLIMEGNMT